MQCSIVNYLEINSTFDFRIDAEYWHPKYLQSKNEIENHKWSYLSDIGKIKGGKRLPLGETFSQEGIPYIRAEDVKYFVDYEYAPRISNELHQKLAQYQTKANDILITIVGNSIGDVGFVKFDLKKCNLTENCAKITDLSLLPDYVFIFLISKYGQNQIDREKVGTAQPKLALARIANFKIPILDKFFQAAIQKVVKKSYKILKESKYQYVTAQTLLLSELSLADWQPKHSLTFIKNYSDTQRAERIDAEYFQPKYEEIVHAIKSYAAEWDKLKNLVTIKKCVEVGSKEYLTAGIPFVRVSNLSPFEITEEKYISEALYEDIQKHQPEQGEILFSKDATPGIAHYLREQPPKMIPSGGILRLKSKTDKLNNEYLTLVLNSILTKEQVNRDVGGSVILHWRPDQVQGTVIPILPTEKQTQIQQKVAESFNLRKQSKHLLKCAKRAMEMAIEQDEQTAIDWLEDETGKMEI